LKAPAASVPGEYLALETLGITLSAIGQWAKGACGTERQGNKMAATDAGRLGAALVLTGLVLTGCQGLGVLGNGGGLGPADGDGSGTSVVAGLVFPAEISGARLVSAEDIATWLTTTESDCSPGQPSTSVDPLQGCPYGDYDRIAEGHFYEDGLVAGQLTVFYAADVADWISHNWRSLHGDVELRRIAEGGWSDATVLQSAEYEAALINLYPVVESGSRGEAFACALADSDYGPGQGSAACVLSTESTTWIVTTSIFDGSVVESLDDLATNTEALRAL